MEWTVFLEVLSHCLSIFGVDFCSWPLRNGDAIGGSCGKPCGYLLHNFHSASIFMGGYGSLIIGFLLAVQAIQFVGLNEIPAFVEVFVLYLQLCL